jgi:DNA-binding NarL/FixJ family response regulator
VGDTSARDLAHDICGGWELMLRILLADDHEIVRRGLKELLEEQSGWTVCAEAANGREAVELAIETRPQVAVIDFSMPELNGLEATRRIVERAPETQVLVFTMHDSDELIRQVLEAGARGYLLKSEATRQLVPAVESLSRRKPYFSGRVSEVVLQGFLRPAAAAKAEFGVERLTSREREIVQLLAEGNTNKDIARRLGLSVKTVETHRAAVLRKLGLPSLVDLVRWAIRNNLVQA